LRKPSVAIEKSTVPDEKRIVNDVFDKTRLDYRYKLRTSLTLPI